MIFAQSIANLIFMLRTLVDCVTIEINKPYFQLLF